MHFVRAALYVYNNTRAVYDRKEILDRCGGGGVCFNGIGSKTKGVVT